MKITIIGAGYVGVNTCHNIAIKDIVDDIVLVDINDTVKGKVIDLMQSKFIHNFKTNIHSISDNNYDKCSNSDIIIITCGIARKPGMSREELFSTNYKIVKGVVDKLLQVSPNSIFIVVTNPMDKILEMLNFNTNIPRSSLIGMGNILDTSRFKYHIYQELINQNMKLSLNIKANVIGLHTDKDMIPLINHAKVDKVFVKNIFTKDILKKIVHDTKNGGRTITDLMGTSAYYAPAASITEIVECIIHDSKKVLSCSTLLNGEYGIHNKCIGVPVIIGKNGIEKIMNYDLDDEDLFDLQK
jgi:malate dehydrogenase